MALSLLDRVLRSSDGVRKSAEVARIQSLPLRNLDFSKVQDLTPVFLKRDATCSGCDLCRHGTPKLRPIQSAALWEASQANGLFAPIGVGCGKELICLLLPEVLDAKRTVILTKPRLRDQMLRVDIPRYSKHFLFKHDAFRVVGYSELSSVNSAGILDELQPDLIICNEGHNLKNRQSARTKRFSRYMKDHPECKLAYLSGTPAGSSILDYQHLIEMALGRNCPLPWSYHELQDWAAALDADSETSMPPGALLWLCGSQMATVEINQLATDPSPQNAKRSARRVYRHRLTGTEGVVASTDNLLDTKLQLVGLYPEIPVKVRDALANLRKLWRIEDEDLPDAKDVSRVARQLANGFYYRWVWPGGIKDEEWLLRRSEWHKEVRHVLRYSSRPGLDSPLLVARAASAGSIHSTAWAGWAEVRDRWSPQPPVEAVWLSDFMIQKAKYWANTFCTEKSPGVVWYEHTAVGKALEAAGIPTFGAGKEGDGILDFRGKSCAASIAAHGEGKNLQHFCKGLVLTPPANGIAWEQLIGRFHRPGQTADVVEFSLCLHDLSLQNALLNARKDAQFFEETLGQKQKLLYAESRNLCLDKVTEEPQLVSL